MHKNLIVFLFILFSNSAFCQYNVVKLDFLGILYPNLKIFRPSVERSFNKHFSALLAYETGRYGYGTTSRSGSQDLLLVTKGWGIMPEIRYYPFTKKKPAPRGFFAGAHFRYRRIIEQYDGPDLTKSHTIYITTKGNAFNYGINIGYKLIAGHFILEILYGAGLANGNWHTPNERHNIDPFFQTKLTGINNFLRFEISPGFLYPKLKKTKVNNLGTPKNKIPHPVNH